MIYEGGGYYSDNNIGVDKEEESVTTEITNDMILEAANIVLKRFRKLDIDWEKEVDEISTEEVDIIDDLMPLNVGKVYLKLQEKDLDRKKYYMIPL